MSPKPVQSGGQKYVSPQDADTPAQALATSKKNRKPRGSAALQDVPKKAEAAGGSPAIVSSPSIQTRAEERPVAMSYEERYDQEFSALLDGYLDFPEDLRDELDLPKLRSGATPAECLHSISEGVAKITGEISRLKTADVTQINLHLKRVRLELAVGSLQGDLDKCNSLVGNIQKKIDLSSSTKEQRTESRKNEKQAADTTNARLQFRHAREKEKKAELTDVKHGLEDEIEASEHTISSVRGNVDKLRGEIEKALGEIESNNKQAVVVSEQAGRSERAQKAFDDKLGQLSAMPDQRSVEELDGMWADVIAAKRGELSVKRAQVDKNREMTAECERDEAALGRLERAVRFLSDRLTGPAYLSMAQDRDSAAAVLQDKEKQLAVKKASVAKLEEELGELTRKGVPQSAMDEAQKTIDELKAERERLRARVTESA